MFASREPRDSIDTWNGESSPNSPAKSSPLATCKKEDQLPRVGINMGISITARDLQHIFGSVCPPTPHGVSKRQPLHSCAPNQLLYRLMQ